MDTRLEEAIFVPMLRLALVRELGAVRRSVEAYPDDASLWATRPGLPNTGGTLVLHIAGNLQHFLGTVLAGTTYRRNREAEFARRDVPRAELLAELDAAIEAVNRALLPAGGDDERASLDAHRHYPEPVGGRTLVTGEFLVHLTTHLAFHLGQLDYHRRVVTGDARSVNAIALAEVPGVATRA